VPTFAKGIYLQTLGKSPLTPQLNKRANNKILWLVEGNYTRWVQQGVVPVPNIPSHACFDFNPFYGCTIPAKDCGFGEKHT
jgi:hypothetical protein